MNPLKACAITIVLALFPAISAAQSDPASDFLRPPAQARPHTWWHWMNGNITREGITADLEAMKAVGLGGAQIFNVSESIPDGPAPFMSPQWRELFSFAVHEADRLGLELCVHNCAGWSSSGGPWITPENAMQMVVSSETTVEGPKRFEAPLAQPETRLDYYRDIAVLAFPTPRDAKARIGDIRVKAGYDYRYDQQPALNAYPADAVVSRKDVIDLSRSMDASGKLTWDVPAGSWTILRFGYTPTGAKNAPAPESGRGLECDKFSRAAFDAHWAGMMGPVLHDLGPLAGKTLANCLIDSYEVGGQNWTARFREEFNARRGYDPIMLLPVLTGRVVDSGEVSERFLWDFRRTIADLFADNYYGYFAEVCHRNGLKASIEPYDGPFECLLSGRDADIPMGEFWVGGGESSSCRLAASVAHIYGRRIVGAESFTADPNAGRWQNHPYSLKSVGDLMYTLGINRYIIHRYAHQPWLDKVPGMTMGQWGTHFERTNTWWTQSADWLRYLSRCQALLQDGRFCADVCFFAGDAAPNSAPHVPALKAMGYDYDACNADVLRRRMSVQDGRLVLPDGVDYRILVLPDSPFMLPGTLARVRDLVSDGATVVGPRPSRSPSLAGYPACDQEVSRLADELWGTGAPSASGEHSLGKGRVVWGRTPEQVLAEMGAAPDCEFAAATGKMAWIHRRDADADIYFVSSQSPRSQDVACTFRISGKVPELWRPDTGSMASSPVWHEENGRITVPIRFDPSGSVFVVFREHAGSADHLASITAPGDAAAAHPHKIDITNARYEATDGAGGADVTAKVAAMVKSGELRIPASNSVFGDPAYLHVKRLRVQYTLDGKPLTMTADENQTLDLVEVGPEMPAAYTILKRNGLQLCAFHPGVYELRTELGKSSRIEIPSVHAPLEVQSPWTVRFQPGRGAPPSITLDKLASWTENPDAGVRYFSGAAEYETQLDIPSELLGDGRTLWLDLGRVQCIAEVSLNGHDLGTWWKPPFAAEISGIARPGRNMLHVRVTNLWINRLIGDEQLPDDCEWNGKPLRKWPDWLLKGVPRPSQGRITFTTWKHYTKDSPLVESGLIGPVLLRPGRLAPLQVASP